MSLGYHSEGAWIVAYEQEDADRARYGERLIAALAAAFKARGVGGLSRSNLKKYRQIALTWPTLEIRQTLSGESGPSQIWQTLSSESVPALPTEQQLRAWLAEERELLARGTASREGDP